MPFGQIIVEFAIDFQAGFRRRRADELDNNLMAQQRYPVPDYRDESEQALFDLFHLLVPGGR
jgi:hypothetical protein